MDKDTFKQVEEVYVFAQKRPIYIIVFPIFFYLQKRNYEGIKIRKFKIFLIPNIFVRRTVVLYSRYNSNMAYGMFDRA